MSVLIYSTYFTFSGVDCLNKADKGASYGGNISTTERGKMCKLWKDSAFFKELYQNYCRNPDNSTRPWCYTIDNNPRWQYCTIMQCCKYSNY